MAWRVGPVIRPASDDSSSGWGRKGLEGLSAVGFRSDGGEKSD